MNGGGIKVGRVFGIPIVIDTSWLVIFFLIVFSFWADLGDAQARNLVDPVDEGMLWIGAVAGAVLFFGSVLIHELSHSFVALRRGIPVRQIRLFIFGGVSEIEEEASKPQDEFAMTIAGPLSSLVLAGAFYGISLLLGDRSTLDQLASRLSWVNLLLGGFNLLPGFPLDGGRVLRSIVWRVTGDYRRATTAAAGGGRLLAGLMIAVGLVRVFLRGDFSGLWWIVLGWFLYQASGASLAQLTIRQSMKGVVAAQLMTRMPLAIGADLTLQEAFDQHFMRHNYSVFPVVQEGRVRGLIALKQLSDQPRDRWGDTRVGQIMQVLEPEDAVGPDTAAEQLLSRLVGKGQRVVVVEEGRLVGIISPSDVTRWLQRQSI